MVGEGGNLGFTQPGRIEAARAGVLLNTDAIDNSAGVDTSDHEVRKKGRLAVEANAEAVQTAKLSQEQNSGHSSRLNCRGMRKRIDR